MKTRNEEQEEEVVINPEMDGKKKSRTWMVIALIWILASVLHFINHHWE